MTVWTRMSAAAGERDLDRQGSLWVCLLYCTVAGSWWKQLCCFRWQNIGWIPEEEVCMQVIVHISAWPWHRLWPHGGRQSAQLKQIHRKADCKYYSINILFVCFVNCKYTACFCFTVKEGRCCSVSWARVTPINMVHTCQYMFVNISSVAGLSDSNNNNGNHNNNNKRLLARWTQPASHSYLSWAADWRALQETHAKLCIFSLAVQRYNSVAFKGTFLVPTKLD